MEETVIGQIAVSDDARGLASKGQRLRSLCDPVQRLRHPAFQWKEIQRQNVCIALTIQQTWQGQIFDQSRIKECSPLDLHRPE